MHCKDLASGRKKAEAASGLSQLTFDHLAVSTVGETVSTPQPPFPIYSALCIKLHATNCNVSVA